jgi:hypothetical protein
LENSSTQIRFEKQRQNTQRRIGNCLTKSHSSTPAQQAKAAAAPATSAVRVTNPNTHHNSIAALGFFAFRF